MTRGLTRRNFKLTFCSADFAFLIVPSIYLPSASIASHPLHAIRALVSSRQSLARLALHQSKLKCCSPSISFTFPPFTTLRSPIMPAPIDLFILALTILLPLAWYFRDSLPIIGGRSKAGGAGSGGAAGIGKKGAVEEGDPRDFVGKMERGVSAVTFFHQGYGICAEGLS